MSTAAMVIGVLIASGTIASGTMADKIIGIAAATLAAMGYTVQRTAAKK